MSQTGPLPERMAAIARELHALQSDPNAALGLAVEAACSSMPGCDGAAVSLVRPGRTIETMVATTDLATACEALQHDLGEGPCLDSVWTEPTVHSADVAQDLRWPTWGPRVARDAGVRSILVLRLFTHGGTLGALNLYSCQPDTFGAEAHEEGSALAAHLAVAVASAQEVAHLRIGLDSRTVVGQATGMLMERYGLDPVAAFALLTRLSSTENVKLRVVAAQVVAGRTLRRT